MVKNPAAGVTPTPTGPVRAPADDPPQRKVLDAVHDAGQQVRNLRQVLENNTQRIGCFLGAGCPLGIFDATGQTSIALIPAVVELTKRVASDWRSR